MKRADCAALTLILVFLPLSLRAAATRLTTHGFSAVFPGPVNFTAPDPQNGKAAHWDCTLDRLVISVSYERKKLSEKNSFAELESLSRDTFFDKAQSRRLRIDGRPAILSTLLLDDVTIEEVTVNRFITRRLLLVERNSDGYYRVMITSCDEPSNRMAQSFLKNFHVVSDKTPD